MQQHYAEKRIQKPHRFYQAPASVVADSKLTQGENLEVLKTMRHDAVLMAKATAENMTGGPISNLRAIELAIQEIKSATEAS